MRLELLGTLFFAGVRPGTSFLVFRGHDLVRNSAAQLRPTLTYAASSSDASFEPDQSSATGAADEALSGALTALGDSDVRLAQELLGSAMEGYRAVGLVDERAPLVAMVQQRIGQKVALSSSSSINSLQVDHERVEEAKLAGDKVFARASACFQAKDHRGAIDLVQEARGIFAAAGDGGALARDREKVLGNLYAVALAEMDRGAKMEKLLEMKKLNDLVKLKRQAEVFGIDWDAFKEVAGID